MMKLVTVLWHCVILVWQFVWTLWEYLFWLDNSQNGHKMLNVILRFQYSDVCMCLHCICCARYRYLLGLWMELDWVSLQWYVLPYMSLSGLSQFCKYHPCVSHHVCHCVYQICLFVTVCHTACHEILSYFVVKNPTLYHVSGTFESIWWWFQFGKFFFNCLTRVTIRRQCGSIFWKLCPFHQTKCLS